MRHCCERITSLALLGLVMMAAITAAPQGRAAGPVQIVLLSSSTPVTSISVGQGFAKQVTAKQMFFRASGQASNSQDVTARATWISADPTIASVFHGSVTGNKIGSTTITVTSGPAYGSILVTVVPPPVLKSIAVTPPGPTIPNGLAQQFTATGTYSDGSTQDLTNSATWSSDNPGTASVNSTGLATCLTAANTTYIRAASGIVSGATALHCTAPNLTSISVTPANSMIANGTMQNMVATGHYTDNTAYDVTKFSNWNSSDPTVASIINDTSVITNGQVTGKKQGGAVVITATYNSVSGSTNLTVGPPNLVSIAVTPANPLVTKGSAQQFTATGTYTDSSTQNLSSTAAWSSSAPAVAAINTTGLATASSVGITTITATQNSISGNTSMHVIGPPARFAYTANFLDNTIEEFTVNANGQLRNNGYVFNGPNTGPQGLTVDPGNSYVYVANSNVNTVSAYAINSNGTLAAIAGSPFTAGNGPTMLAFSVRGNGGRSAYVTNGDNTITEFSVNGDGSLSLLTTTAPTTVSPQGIVVTPNGLYAYVTNQGASSGAGNIAQYSIAQNTGALSALSPSTVSAPGFPSAIAVDPFNRFVFVSDVNNTGGSVSAYKINNDGTLAFQNTLAAGKGAIALAVDPSGHFLYSGNYISSNVSAFTIDQTSGALTAVVGTPTVEVGIGPQAVSIDSSGQFLYVGHFSSHEVWEYGIDGTSGALSFLRKIRSGKGVDGMAISSGSSAPVYTDFLAFDVNGAGVGETFVNGSTGALLTPFSMYTPASPAAVAVDPYERFVYATNTNNNSVSQYSVGNFGSLTFIGAIGTGNLPANLTVDPSGRFLYVAANAGVFGFTIDQSSGLLTAISGGVALGAGGSLTQITTDPTGRFLFVGNSVAHNVSVYGINPADGTLSLVTVSPAGSGGDTVAVDPSGRFLYTSENDTFDNILKTLVCQISAANGAIACSETTPGKSSTGIAVEPYGRYAYALNEFGLIVAYGIDQTTGFLTALGPPVAAAGSSIAVDIQGQYVYVTNKGSNTISAYKINPNTGAITEITGAGSPFAAGTSPGLVVISGVIQ